MCTLFPFPWTSLVYCLLPWLMYLFHLFLRSYCPPHLIHRVSQSLFHSETLLNNYYVLDTGVCYYYLLPFILICSFLPSFLYLPFSSSDILILWLWVNFYKTFPISTYWSPSRYKWSIKVVRNERLIFPRSILAVSSKNCVYRIHRNSIYALALLCPCFSTKCLNL